MFSGPDHREDQPVWQILPESEFYPFSVPFEMQGSTKVSDEIFGTLNTKKKNVLKVNQLLQTRAMGLTKSFNINSENKK